MKIELKKFKYAAFASQETNCFEAEVWIDGKRAGHAENDGHGGPTHISPNTLNATLDAYAATLPDVQTDMMDPHDKTKPFTYKQTGEHLIDEAVSDLLLERDLTKALKKRVLFTRTGEAGIRETKCLTAEQMTRAMADMPTFLRMIPKVDKVLNTMPFADALALYKSI